MKTKRDTEDEDMPFGGHVGYMHTSGSKFIAQQCMCDECERGQINGWKDRKPVTKEEKKNEQ